MYPKFKEIALDTATWTVAFLGAIEERETKSKKPFARFICWMETSLSQQICGILRKKTSTKCRKRV